MKSPKTPPAEVKGSDFFGLIALNVLLRDFNSFKGERFCKVTLGLMTAAGENPEFLYDYVAKEPCPFWKSFPPTTPGI
jgi:hypothetical protein